MEKSVTNQDRIGKDTVFQCGFLICINLFSLPDNSVASMRSNDHFSSLP